MSRWVPEATVAIEDRRFYEHGGLDPEGIARALWANLKARDVVEGGSTISQQLVRNLYPVSRERTVERKLKEACLAIKLNAQLLEGVDPLHLPQPGLLRKPRLRDRGCRADVLLEAGSLALDLARRRCSPGSRRRPRLRSVHEPEAGARAPQPGAGRRCCETGSLTRPSTVRAGRRPLDLKPGRLYQEIREPYFFGFVRDRLIEEYGAERVRSGGLKVYTTISPRYQRLARAAIRETLTEPTDPAAALVSIEPATGAIRAMAAVIPGRRRNEFNLLSQARRQPGSTFKTFVLTAAVEQGINPASNSYVSAPFIYKPVENGSCEDDTWWCVKTYDSSYYGWSSIEQATLRSDNAVFAQLTLDVGPGRVAATARKMGVRSPLASTARSCPRWGSARSRSPRSTSPPATRRSRLGASTPRRARSARSCCRTARRTRRRAGACRRRKRVLSDGVATRGHRDPRGQHALRDRHPRRFGRPAAGKTGTTDQHADAWFAGYTPDLQTTVWVGYTKGEIPMENVHGIPVTGGSFPAEIWRLFMERALSNRPVRDFLEPRRAHRSGCRSSGGRTRSPTTRTTCRPRPRPRTTRSRREAERARRRGRRSSRERGPAAGRLRRRGVRVSHGRDAASARRSSSGAATSYSSPPRRLSPGRTGRRSCPRGGGAPSRVSGELPRACSPLAFGLYVLALGCSVARAAPLAIGRRARSRDPARAARALHSSLSTDAWTYWAYGRDCRGRGRQSVRRSAELLPGEPGVRRHGRAWRDTTSVYGPASRSPPSRSPARWATRSDAAAWIVQGPCGGGRLCCGRLLAARVARRRSLAAAFVGWNPLLAVHLAGGGPQRRAGSERSWRPRSRSRPPRSSRRLAGAPVGARRGRQVGADRAPSSGLLWRARPAAAARARGGGCRGCRSLSRLRDLALRRSLARRGRAPAGERRARDELRDSPPARAARASRRLGRRVPSRRGLRRRLRAARCVLPRAAGSYLGRAALLAAGDDAVPRRLVPRLGRAAGGRRGGPVGAASAVSPSARTCFRRESRSTLWIGTQEPLPEVSPGHPIPPPTFYSIGRIDNECLEVAEKATCASCVPARRAR